MSSRWVIGLEVKGETTIAENFIAARKNLPQQLVNFRRDIVIPNETQHLALFEETQHVA
jgi:hypothetical protein